MPIWFNTMICDYFNKEWLTKGLIFVNDFFIDESFVTLEYLRNVIGVKCNFLEYKIIKNKISNLKIILNNNNSARPVFPNILNIIQLGGKGCQKYIYYKVIQKK